MDASIGARCIGIPVATFTTQQWLPIVQFQQRRPGPKNEDYQISKTLGRTSRRFKFETRSQLFIGANNETLYIAVGVCNPDRSPLRIHG
jgi:hypothetical protein